MRVATNLVIMLKILINANKVSKLYLRFHYMYTTATVVQDIGNHILRFSKDMYFSQTLCYFIIFEQPYGGICFCTVWKVGVLLIDNGDDICLCEGYEQRFELRADK